MSASNQPELEDRAATLLMCWEGAELFGAKVPPMRDFLPNAYARWYDKLINEILPGCGDEAMGAFIDAGFHPLTFYKRHARPIFRPCSA